MKHLFELLPLLALNDGGPPTAKVAGQDRLAQ